MRRAPALALALASLATAAPVAAQDDEMIEYTVQPGDTCPIIATRMWGDSARIDMIHATNPGMGPGPHKLKPGATLRLRRTLVPKTTPDARLSYVRNRVEASTPERHPGQPMEPLMRGHRVNTFEQSSAEVLFSTEARIQLGEHTLVVVLGTSRGAVSKTATASDATLVTGALRAHLDALAGEAPPRVAVGTPGGARVDLGHGEAIVDVDRSDTTRLAVHRGTQALSAQGQRVAVAQGFGSKAEKNKPPTPPRPLPAPPRWTALPGSVVFADGPAQIAGTYGPGVGDGAAAPAAWRVQLARDERFNALVLDAKVGLDTTTLVARDLPPGRYVARVAAIDADKFEGPMSAPVTVVVAPLRVSPEPRSPQRATVEVPAGIFCGVDGAALTLVTGPLAVRRGPPHTLRCAAAADGLGASETRLPAQRLAPLTVRAVLVPGGRATEGTLRFTLTDAAGEPVAEAKVRAQPASGVTMGDVLPAAEAGTYEARVRWGEAPSGVRVRLEVNGVDEVEAPWVPLPPPRAESRSRGDAGPTWREGPKSGEAALLAGLGTGGEGLDVGPALAAELGAPLTERLIVAGRVGWERYARAGSAPCSAAPLPVGGPCASEYSFDLSQSVVTLGTPLSLRLARPGAPLVPYLGVSPQLMLEVYALDGRGTAIREAYPRFAVHGYLGGQLRTGRGAGVFLELGYRAAASARRAPGESPLAGVLSQLGFRWTL